MALGRKRKKRHDMRSEQQCGHGVLEFYHGSLRRAFEAGNVREFDKATEGERGKFQGHEA